jgi:hypothetical protein
MMWVCFENKKELYDYEANYELCSCRTFQCVFNLLLDDMFHVFLDTVVRTCICSLMCMFYNIITYVVQQGN